MATFEENQTTLDTLGEEIEATESIEFADDKANDTADTGFTIFTLRFAEPRDVKTRDEVVNQIIQVAFPTGATGIAAFETVCKGLAGKTDAAAEA